MKVQRSGRLHRVVLGMLIVVGLLPWVVTGATITPTNVTGSANHVGDGTIGIDRAQVRFVGKFTAVLGSLADCIVTLDEVLFEVGGLAQGELVQSVSGVVLKPRSGSSATAAIFEKSGRPAFRMDMKTRGGNTFEFNLKIDRATIPNAPATETISPGPGDPDQEVANLRTSFTVNCLNAVEVETTRQWRQDPLDDFSFRTP